MTRTELTAEPALPRANAPAGHALVLALQLPTKCCCVWILTGETGEVGGGNEEHAMPLIPDSAMLAQPCTRHLARPVTAACLQG